MERCQHTEMTTKNPYANTRFVKFMLNLFSRNIIFFRCISWIKYNFCFCKAAAFASGLLFSYKLAEKAIMNVFITYFTVYANFDILEATGMVNFEEGLSASLAIVMVYISEVFSGHLKRIIFCLILTYACGMGIFGLTGSYLLPESDLTDSYVDRELPFGLLIYIAVVLIAVGRAGFVPFVRRFTAEQFEAHEPDQQNIVKDRVMGREKMWWFFARGAGSLVAIPLFNSSWTQRFLISGWVMGIAYVLFMLFSPSYHKREPADVDKRPFTCIRVACAALKKRHLEYPSSPEHFFGNDGSYELELWPQAKSLRWLDKAAIIEFESTLGQDEQEKAGRLWTVTKVQETKHILKMVPMWFAFVMLGLVLAAGNTFFPEQGIYLKSPGHLIYLVLLQSITSATVSNVSPFLLSKWFPEAKLKQNMIRIWAGLLISILCSGVAWMVEVHRLGIDLVMESSGTVPSWSIVTIWWLAPQFFLLGLMDGLATAGLEDFTNDDDHLSQSMKSCLSAINGFVVIGIGNVLNLLFVSPNLTFIGSALNIESLGQYYEYLTIYCSPLNCVYLLFISIKIYGCNDTAQANEESQTERAFADAA